MTEETQNRFPDFADVVVVGGGIAGLGLACALTQHGLGVMVIEKRRTTGGIHRGDSLLPKATALLHRWGVLDAIRAANARPIGRLEVHARGHGELFATSLVNENAPYPYLVLPHARIESVLMAEALRRGAVIARPAKALGTLTDPLGRVCGVRFEIAGESREVRARVVVAADGARSVVRRDLGIEGYCHRYDHAYLGLEADRPAAYDDAMRVHLDPAGGLLVMPRPDRVGLGVLVDSGTARHWMTITDEELARDLTRRAPILSGMKLYRDGAHVYELTRSHADRYVHRGAVIIGDAAHTTNPTAGQGMAMALTDAGALADRLSAAIAAGGAPTALDLALADYEQTQWPANEAVIRASHRLAVAYGLRGRKCHALETALLRILGSGLGTAIARPIIATFLHRADDASSDKVAGHLVRRGAP